MKGRNLYLIAAGACSIAVAILHVAVIVGGSAWYRFFGAGERMANMSEQGSWIPGVMTFGVTIVFIVWGLYAFSGANLLRRLPFLKIFLVLISMVYLVRGLSLIPLYFIALEEFNAFWIWSSLISLSFGLLYAVGIKQEWQNLSV